MNYSLPRKKRTRTGVSIPDDLLMRIKRYADLHHGGNVSKLIAETMEQRLEGSVPTLPDSMNDRVVEELARSLHPAIVGDLRARWQKHPVSQSRFLNRLLDAIPEYLAHFPQENGALVILPSSQLPPTLAVAEPPPTRPAARKA